MRLTCSFQIFLYDIQPPYNTDGNGVLINNSFLTKFFFIENLEDMYITGELHINDKNGYFETIKLTGKETFTVVLQQKILSSKDGTNSDYKEYSKVIDFEILDIEIDDMNFKNNIYKFVLVEKGAFKYYGKNYNKTYLNKTVSEVINDVMINQLELKENQFEVEKTFDVMDNFTIPYWKPFLSLKSLRLKARRLTTPHEGGFLFYSTWGDENKNFPIKKFVSFASLIEQKLRNQTSVDNIDTYLFKDYSSNSYFINNIKECGTLTYANRRTLFDGIGGKHYFGVDYKIDKNIIEEKQTYSDYINKVKILGKEAYLDTDINNINDDVDIIGGSSFMVKARQDSSFRFLLEHFKIKEIIMEGTLFRYVGQKIFLENKSDIVSEQTNIIETGEWIIKHITSYFDDSGIFMQKLHIIKDGLEKTGLTSSKIIGKN